MRKKRTVTAVIKKQAGEIHHKGRRGTSREEKKIKKGKNQKKNKTCLGIQRRGKEPSIGGRGVDAMKS